MSESQHGKSDAIRKIKALFFARKELHGALEDSPLLDKYATCIIDPNGKAAKEIFESLPPDEQKRLIDEVR